MPNARPTNDPATDAATASVFAQDDFALRRKQLLTHLDGGAVILAAAHPAARNNDVDYEFRQDSTFWYFTGLEEPDAVAVLRPGRDDEYVLFVNPFDPKFEIWVGARVGVDGAKTALRADDAFPIDDLEDKLPELLSESQTIYYSLGSDRRIDQLLTDLAARRRSSGQRDDSYIRRIIDPAPVIGSMRVQKSTKEIEALQHAIDITAQGFDRAIRQTRPDIPEYHIQTALENEFRNLGSPRNGYPSIVASGENSCILHYIENRRKMQDGDLLLIDAGAEFEYYSADVTRTWPVSGRFTPEQRAVYDIVLEAQRKAIDIIAPGVELRAVHKTALEVLVQGLIHLGALDGDVDRIIEDKAYEPYYMHGTSHWLGLDVHDAGIYRSGDDPVLLQEGMIFTVEPGLYFGPHAADAPDRLRGIGIRIEDDVLVTSRGHRVMSAAIPKAPDVLESMIGAAAR